MARNRSVTLKLSTEEYEWLRRRAHWEQKPMATLLREHLHQLVAEDGYLRPPDDDPQDFGYEKEMMQFVLGVQNRRE